MYGAGIEELPLAQGVCLPGEPALHVTGNATVVLGRGLVQRRRPQPAASVEEEEDVTLEASAGGRLASEVVTVGTSAETGLAEKAKQYRVVSEGRRRYVPAKGDAVVGVVVRAMPSGYVLHIGAAHGASLDALAFDGASKANKPKVAVGDLIYCRVDAAEPDAETELSCCAVGDMPRKDWSTGEAVFGPLSRTNAATLVVSLHEAEMLIANRNPVLLLAGQRASFEAVIGQNGRVWFRVPPTLATPRKVLVALLRCVQESGQCANAAEVEGVVDRFFPSAPSAGPAAEADEEDAPAEAPAPPVAAPPVPAAAAAEAGGGIGHAVDAL